MPKTVFASIPNTTAVPRAIREFAPAPVAKIRGIMPIMNVNDVMSMGRSLMRPASIAASLILMPLARKSTAYSTISMAFFADKAINRIIPICV